MPPGPVEANAWAAGFRHAGWREFVVPAEEPLRLEMRASLLIAGRVVDREDRPVRAARIEALGEDGEKRLGFSDLRGTATLSYRLDEHTTIAVSVAASTLIDTDIERWVNNRAIVSDHGGGNFRRGINTDTVWGTAGVSWKF